MSLHGFNDNYLNSISYLLFNSNMFIVRNFWTFKDFPFKKKWLMARNHLRLSLPFKTIFRKQNKNKNKTNNTLFLLIWHCFGMTRRKKGCENSSLLQWQNDCFFSFRVRKEENEMDDVFLLLLMNMRYAFVWIFFFFFAFAFV